MLISAHLPTTQGALEDFNVSLHEIEQAVRKYPDHDVILGVDANTEVYGYEDGWRERPLSLIFLRALVSFRQTRGVGKSLLVLRQRDRGTMTNSLDTRTKSVTHTVRATSRVRHREVDHSMDTEVLTVFAPITGLSLAVFPLKSMPSNVQNAIHAS